MSMKVTNWSDGRRPRNPAERQYLQNRADLGRLLIFQEEVQDYVRNLERNSLESQFLAPARERLLEINAAIRTTEAKIAAFEATFETGIESRRDQELLQELKNRENKVRAAEAQLSRLRDELREFKASMLAEGVTIEASLA